MEAHIWVASKALTKLLYKMSFRTEARLDIRAKAGLNLAGIYLMVGHFVPKTVTSDGILCATSCSGVNVQGSP